MIEQLLEIKKIRADRADSAVQQQEYRVNSALSLLRKAEQSVVDYHQWRKERRRATVCQSEAENGGTKRA